MELLKAPPFLVFIRESKLHPFRDRPFYSNVRIIPDQAAFVSRMIEVRAFVGELCTFRKYQKSMSKSLWNKELFFIFC